MNSRSPHPRWAHQVWLAGLVVGVSALSFVFGCATPFAAFAVLAAMTLSRPDAIRTTVALWMVNQVIGYGVLGYPRTVSSVTWGLAIGIAAVSCTLVARLIIRRPSAARGPIRTAVALGATFAVYEAALLAVAVSGLGGTESFALGIVTRILAVNAVAFVGLYGLHRLGAVIGLSGSPIPIPSSVARPAS